MRAALITAMLFVIPLAAEAADVKLIRGFEWEELLAGEHEVVVEFFDSVEGASITFYWSKPM